MAVSYATYERLALEDDAIWELVCGRPREKTPVMTQEHNSIASNLMRQLVRLLPDELRVSMNAPALKTPVGNYFVPDVIVLPEELE